MGAFTATGRDLWALAGLAAAAALALLLPAEASAETVTFVAKGAEPAGAWNGTRVAFWAFGVLALVGAVATITRRNPVSAALTLVLSLFCTGGLFLVLQATFLAAIQVLVYAGAIMVLFIFVVMAVSNYEEEELGLAYGVTSKLVGLVALGVLLWVLAPVLSGAASSLPQPTAVVEGFGDVRAVGKLLFTDYLFPFEALSILLLVAIVGAVMVTRHPRPRAEREGG